MLTNYLYRHQSRLVYFNITTNSSMSKKEIFHKSILCKMIFQKSGSLQLLHHVTTSNRPFVHLGNNFVQNSSYFHSLIGRNFLLLNIIIFVQKNISWCRYSRSSFFFFILISCVTGWLCLFTTHSIPSVRWSRGIHSSQPLPPQYFPLPQ